MNTYHPACSEDLSKKNQEQSKDNKGILESAREIIHEKVATDEQLYQEKSFTEKIKDSIPCDTKEAVDMLGSAFSADATSKTTTNQMDLAPSVIPQTFKATVQEKISEATKPPSMGEKDSRRSGKMVEGPTKILAGPE